MYNQFQGQNLYKTKLSSDILPGVATDENEYYFDVIEATSCNSCYVYLNFADETKRERIEIHRTGNGGTRMYFYQYNRENCTKTHEVDDFIQINAVAQYFDSAMQNIDTLGWTRKMGNPGVKVKVYGGSVEDLDSQFITVGDKAITCSVGDNYIYYDHIANEFAVSSTQPTEYDLMSKVTVVGSDITSITDMRAFKVRLKNGAVLSKFTESGGHLLWNGTQII